MAFHVEISVPMRHARVFNLNREDLFAKVIGPWLENRLIEMGDREKAKSALSDARQAVGKDAERLRQLNEGLKNLGLDG